nr:hypothetical protein [Tanacetum cinerariifolium]
MYDAPDGFVGLYVHSFTLSNLRIPVPKFVCEVLDYFRMHLSRLNLFGYAKLTTFFIMCKAYSGEPMVELFKGFRNLFPVRDWLTLAKRSEAEVPTILLKPISCLEDRKEMLSKANKLDKKNFKDKIPPFISETLMYQHLA